MKLPFLNSIGETVEKIGNAIDENFTNKEEIEKCKIELQRVELEATKLYYDHQTSIVNAETERLKTEKESFLQKNWRPFLFFGLSLSIVYSYTIAPIFNLPQTKFDDNIWTLINFGIGGYTTLLGVGKVVKEIKTPKK